MFPQTTHLNNEIWEIERNRYDWELRYLHPNYSASAGTENPAQPCPDVFWFPIFTGEAENKLIHTSLLQRGSAMTLSLRPKTLANGVTEATA